MHTEKGEGEGCGIRLRQRVNKSDIRKKECAECGNGQPANKSDRCCSVGRGGGEERKRGGVREIFKGTKIRGWKTNPQMQEREKGRVGIQTGKQCDG